MKSVNRALDVLFAIAGADHPQSAMALSKKLDLPRPTVYRILDTLEGRGIVAKTESGTVVTPKLGLLLADNANAVRLSDLIQPFLQRLVAATKETSGLHVRVGDLRRCVAEVEGYHGIRWARGPGFTAPVWSGAVGHVILAGLPQGEFEQLLEGVMFAPLATNTACSPFELAKRIEKARTLGWSASQSETVDGAAAVAAPMVDRSGSVAAVLSLYAAADRYEAMQQFVPDLLEIAAEAAELWQDMTSINPETANPPESVSAGVAANKQGRPGH